MHSKLLHKLELDNVSRHCIDIHVPSIVHIVRYIGLFQVQLVSSQILDDEKIDQVLSTREQKSVQ